MAEYKSRLVINTKLNMKHFFHSSVKNYILLKLWSQILSTVKIYCTEIKADK